MHLETMLRIVIAAAVVIALNSNARAQQPLNMPIEFIGEWCFSTRDDKNNSANYTLPSWTADGRCTNIFAIDRYGFYYEKKNCEAVKMQTGKSTAPSGTSYTATITARCVPDGPPTPGVLQTFKIERYKGNLSVTTK
jgi:hypothetical protein